VAGRFLITSLTGRPVIRNLLVSWLNIGQKKMQSNIGSDNKNFASHNKQHKKVFNIRWYCSQVIIQSRKSHLGINANYPFRQNNGFW